MAALIRAAKSKETNIATLYWAGLPTGPRSYFGKWRGYRTRNELLNIMDIYRQDYQDDSSIIDSWFSSSWTATQWSNISSNGRHWPAPETILNPPREYALACAIAWFVSSISLIMWYWLFERISSCPHSVRQSLFLRLLWVIPVVTISSCLSITFVIYSVFLGLVRHCYIGLCLFWHFELVCDRFGGFEGAVQTFAEYRTSCLWWFEQPSAPGAGQAGSIASISARYIRWLQYFVLSEWFALTHARNRQSAGPRPRLARPYAVYCPHGCGGEAPAALVSHGEAARELPSRWEEQAAVT